MTSDQFEYYFELDELEPFATTPLPELAEHKPSKPTKDDDPVPEPAVVAPPKAVSPHSTSPDSHASKSANANTVDVPSDSPPGNTVGITKIAVGNDTTPIASEDDSRADPAISDTRSVSAEPNVSRLPEPVVPYTPSSSPESRITKSAAPVACNVEMPVVEPSTNSARETAFCDDERSLMSVHALGQFVFCTRSGIYSAENVDETDIDEPPPRLNYLPNFDLERIEERLSTLIRYLWTALFLALTLAPIMIIGVAIQNRQLFYPAFAVFLICLLWLVNLVGMIFTLSRRRRAARQAAIREPDPKIERIQPVNWWSMLKAGFEPVIYQRQFRHPHLPLEGSPWRVLERGSLRIPVIKSGADKLGDAKHPIYPKHELRLAAYAVLLEATEHVEVPYGLIFPVDSHLGLAIPITRVLREEVTQKLDHSLDTIRRSQSGESEPRTPKDRKRCQKCRLGEPIRINDAEIAKAKKAGTPLLILKHETGLRFHCECGDRFGSAPPHGRIIQLGLTSTVE